MLSLWKGPVRPARSFSLWKGEIKHVAIDRRSMSEILADVAARYEMTIAELRGSSVKHAIAHPRQEAMADMYDTGRFSLPQIGNYLGGRDHTTILHGVRRHRARVALRPIAEAA